MNISKINFVKRGGILQRYLMLLLLGGLLSLQGQSTAPEWMVRSPEVFRIDSLKLAEAYRFAESISPPLESVLISRGNVLVAEQYFNGFDANDFWNIKSASKSVLSVLIGIAIDEGYIESIHEPIAPYFPEYFEDRPVTDKNLITLQDLITMRSGLETTSNRNYGRWVTSRNWVLWALNQPLIREPGTSMIYSTGNSHLLSVILTRATGMSSLAFAREHLFEPLDINRVIWPRDPQGNYFGGNNMMFRPRDMLKIGHLYLNGGRYNGEQVVPISWVKESIGQYGQSRWSRHWQGYHWWTNWFDGYRTSFAWGHGGQFIFVVPNLDLVVVFTSSLTDRPDNGMNHNRGLLTLLEQYIIPAVIHGKAPLAASDMSAREVLR